MNCKQGDLAIVVRSDAGNAGKIVTCIRLLNGFRHIAPDGSVSNDIWQIDRPLIGWGGEVSCEISDMQLRPLRDPGDDATDETLTWLPVPHKEIA